MRSEIGRKGEAAGENELADGLKRVKKRINKRIKSIILCSVGAAAIWAAGLILLFAAPIKDLSPEDMSVSVSTYRMADIAEPGEDGKAGGAIRADGTNKGRMYRLNIPEMPNADILIGEELYKTEEYVSVLVWESPYRVREIRYSDETEGKTIVVEAINTTVFGNRLERGRETSKVLEFRDVERVVYDKDGEETVLWSR